MPRLNFSRTERFAQMSKQEQLIAQKRQQILEKQRTLELAKQIAAEASKTSHSNEMGEEEQPGKVKLAFSNDGSFLENFKKLSEKIVKQTEEPVVSGVPIEPSTEQPVAAVATAASPVPTAVSGEQMYKFDMPPPSLIPPLPPPPPPPPPQLPTMSDDVHFEPFFDLPPVSTAEDAFSVCFQYDMLHPGSERDLPQGNSIDSPQGFQENDKLPTTVEELIELVADIGDVYEEKLCSRKNDLHPSLWFIFDKQSDAYRNYRHMIVARRQGSPPVGGTVPHEELSTGATGDESKYDPADVLDDLNADEEDEEAVEEEEGDDDDDDEEAEDDEEMLLMLQEENGVRNSSGQPMEEVPIHMLPNFFGDERHFYDDKSTTETDSDTEYVREARERNLKNLKRKTIDAVNRREDSSTDSDDDYNHEGDSTNESTQDRSGNSGGGNSGARSHRQKYRKKSRWGENTDGGGNPESRGAASTGGSGGGGGGIDVGGTGTAGGGTASGGGEGSSSQLHGLGASVGVSDPRQQLQQEQQPSHCDQPQEQQQDSQHSVASSSNPGLLQFVFQSYGTIDVGPENWKKAEYHFRVNELYQEMVEKIQQHEGETGVQSLPTDERRTNTAKTDAIVRWINGITQLYDQIQPQHLSDFLMREEYESFIEKFRLTNFGEPTFEDYRKLKLRTAKYSTVTLPTRNSSSDSDYALLDGDLTEENMRNVERLDCGEQQLADGSRFAQHGEKRMAELDRQSAAKKRKSRWGDQVEVLPPSSSSAAAPGNPFAHSAGVGGSRQQHQVPKLSCVNRTDPALLAYARQNFGSINLSEEDWKKAEDHYKINLLYQDMLRKRQEIDRLANNGRFKYEYDSDEDTTGGTWEHKLRLQEMEATQKWANELTKQSEGKHHIGDFLPPEELRKFMEKYEAQKNNRQPNLSDYKDYKLKEDNVGFQMLQKLGWKQGQGLGADGSGIVDPINKAAQRDNNQGLGSIAPDNPEVNDNEYDAYRKRMMLAYRFRPNPLNNPRRAYY